MATSTGTVDFGGWEPPKKKTKQTSKTTRSSFLDPKLDTGLPSARNDIAVPYLIGRRIIENPNTIWNSVPRTTVTTVETVTEEMYVDFTGNINGSLNNVGVTAPGTTTTMTGTISLKDIIGSRPDEDEVGSNTVVTVENVESRFDFAMCLCLGPSVRLLAVYDENRNKINSQSDTSPNSNDSLDAWRDSQVVNQKAAEMKFYNGAWGQPRDPTILAAEGANKTPAFRGFCYCVFKDAVISEDTIALPYAFDVYRTPDYLELEGDNTNSDHDVNIATAMYEILVSEWSMVGLLSGYVDKESFKVAGIRLAQEENYCTVFMTATSQAKAILGVLSDQAYGALRWNALIKKIQFVLFRNDFEIDDLPLFNEDNLTDVTSIEKDHWISLPKAIQVDFPNRAKFYENTPAIVGLAKSNGEYGRKTEKISYETICKASIAWPVAAREFARAAAPMLTADLQTNRAGASLMPGDVVAVEWPEIYPGKIPFRVVKTKEKGTLLDTTTITVEQAFSPIVNTSYGILEDLAVPTNEDFTPPTGIVGFPVPLYLARYRKPTFVDPVDSYSDNAIYWNVVARDGPSAFKLINYLSKEVVIGKGLKAVTATLIDPMGKMDGYSEGQIGSIMVKPGLNWTNFKSNPTEKQGFFIIGNEIFRYSGALPGDEDGVLITTMYRGLIDTVAEDHAADDEIIFFGDLGTITSYGYDVTDGSQFFEVFASNGKTTSLNSNPVELVPEQRANLPACPQNAMVSDITGDNHYPRPDGPQTVERGEQYYVSWLQRNYLAAQYTDRETERAPTGTTYTLTLRVGGYSAGLGSAISGSEHLVTIPGAAALGNGQIEIKATNANGDSAFVEFVAVTVTA